MSNSVNRVEKVLDVFTILFLGTASAMLVAFYILRKFYYFPLSSSAILLVVASAALAAGLFLGRARRVLYGLSALSLVVSLFLVNALAEAIIPHVPPPWPKPDGFDKRSKYEVVQDFRKEGIDAAPHMCALHIYRSGSGKDLLPLSGFSNKRIVYCNESGTRAHFTTDRFGFNNPDTLYDEPLQDGRMMLLGDSYVDGACVPEGLDVGNQLRALDVPVYNFGCGGNGPLAMLGTWMEYSELAAPDVVVWMYFEANDLLNISEEKNTLLAKYMDPNFKQNLIANDAARVAVIEETLRKEEEKYIAKKSAPPTEAKRDMRLTLFNILSLYHVRDFLGLTSRGINLKAYEEVFLAFHDRIRDSGQKLLFVYLPSFNSIHSQGERSLFPRRFEDFRPQVLDMVKKAGVEILDFEKILLAQEDPEGFFPYRKYNHYNADAYALLADAIAKTTARMD